MDKKRSVPWDFDGVAGGVTSVSNHADIVFNQILKEKAMKSSILIDSWCLVVGPQIAKMSEVTSCWEGIVKITVTNSSLLSLFKGVEREKILVKIRETFPQLNIKDLTVRIG